jgi:hypothetical protein
MARIIAEFSFLPQGSEIARLIKTERLILPRGTTELRPDELPTNVDIRM